MCSGPPLKKLKQTVLSFGVGKALKDAGKLLQIFYDVNWCLFPELVLLCRLQTTSGAYDMRFVPLFVGYVC